MANDFSHIGIGPSVTAVIVVAAGMGLCLAAAAFAQVGPASMPAPPASQPALARMDEALARDWQARWEKNILADSRNRYCDKEMGEELGWLVSPFVNGFYYGYQATGDTKWIDRLIDWSDAVVKRGLKEPDGYIGWPKAAGASTSAVPDFTTDNQLGEAMLLRPMVLMAGEIEKSPALKEKYGAKAREYTRLSEQIFEKWDKRGAWREVKDGGVWVVPPFGLDVKTNQWTAGYDQRNKDGFTLPANKQNLVACWLIAMHDVTGKAVYRDRAEKWWRVMKSRMRLGKDGRYFVWNYWDPAGPWDHKPDGSLKHWVGVHPNGRYYRLDTDAIVAAYEDGLVFTKEDIARLIATNRDFMWNQQLKDPQFGRIDGEKPASNVPGGLLWTALAPHDPTLRKIFEVEVNKNPASWEGLGFVAAPAWVARFGRTAEAGR